MSKDLINRGLLLIDHTSPTKYSGLNLLLKSLKRFTKYFFMLVLFWVLVFSSHHQYILLAYDYVVLTSTCDNNGFASYSIVYLWIIFHGPKLNILLCIIFYINHLYNRDNYIKLGYKNFLFSLLDISILFPKRKLLWTFELEILTQNSNFFFTQNRMNRASLLYACPHAIHTNFLYKFVCCHLALIIWEDGAFENIASLDTNPAQFDF